MEIDRAIDELSPSYGYVPYTQETKVSGASGSETAATPASNDSVAGADGRGANTSTSQSLFSGDAFHRKSLPPALQERLLAEPLRTQKHLTEAEHHVFDLCTFLYRLQQQNVMDPPMNKNQSKLLPAAWRADATGQVARKAMRALRYKISHALQRPRAAFQRARNHGVTGTTPPDNQWAWMLQKCGRKPWGSRPAEEQLERSGVDPRSIVGFEVDPKAAPDEWLHLQHEMTVMGVVLKEVLTGLALEASKLDESQRDAAGAGNRNFSAAVRDSLTVSDGYPGPPRVWASPDALLPTGSGHTVTAAGAEGGQALVEFLYPWWWYADGETSRPAASGPAAMADAHHRRLHDQEVEASSVMWDGVRVWPKTHLHEALMLNLQMMNWKNWTGEYAKLAREIRVARDRNWVLAWRAAPAPTPKIDTEEEQTDTVRERDEHPAVALANNSDAVEANMSTAAVPVPALHRKTLSETRARRLLMPRLRMVDQLSDIQRQVADLVLFCLDIQEQASTSNMGGVESIAVENAVSKVLREAAVDNAQRRDGAKSYRWSGEPAKLREVMVRLQGVITEKLELPLVELRRARVLGVTGTSPPDAERAWMRQKCGMWSHRFSNRPNWHHMQDRLIMVTEILREVLAPIAELGAEVRDVLTESGGYPGPPRILVISDAAEAAADGRQIHTVSVAGDDSGSRFRQVPVEFLYPWWWHRDGEPAYPANSGDATARYHRRLHQEQAQAASLMWGGVRVWPKAELVEAIMARVQDDLLKQLQVDRRVRQGDTESPA